MNSLCIRDLAALIGGRLRLGSLPPLGGQLEPIRDVVVDANRVGPGDVFWGLDGPDGDRSQMAEHAYLRGALGAVIAGRRLEPWAGKFSIEVDDSRLALRKFASAMRQKFTGHVIAIAGGHLRSYVASMIHSALQQLLCGHWLRASSNNLDEAILGIGQLDAMADYCIVQIDMDEPDVLASLVELCEPQIVVLVADGAGSKVAEIHDWDVTARTLINAVGRDASLILDGDDTTLRRSLESDDRHVIWTGCETNCDVSPCDLTFHDKRYSFYIDDVCFPGLAICIDDVRTVVTASAVARVLNVSANRVAKELRSVLMALNLNPAGTVARSPSVEALPFVSAMREADATLPPG